MTSTSTTTIMRRDEDELHSLMNIPVISSTFDFLRHFVLFFLLPIGIVVTLAVVAAAIFSRLYNALFSRYATPEELFDEALRLLKKNDASKDRQKALRNLRLVIKLKSDYMNAYTLLATELFYGELKHAADENQDRRKRESQSRYGHSLTNSRSRQTTSTNNSPVALEECQQVIQQGLSIDSANISLLKLQSELNLVKRYGTNSIHTQMLNVGSFGWR
mmetsp:Transcript_26158/g.37342  ORF Transcript_26158/g.37342 Transcript_26158/m.37342 type:complete len:218 (+) Transcript_26158:168-821(+)